MKAAAPRPWCEATSILREPVVVGVDGSEPSLRAMEWAADEAALRGARLHLVHASTWRHDAEDGWSHDRRLLESAARRAHRRAPEVKISTEVAAEDPGPALLRAARNAGALVLGSRGRAGLTELLCGSVSLTVAARAECPVIVVRGPHDSAAHGRVVVGVGGPAAVRFAVREAVVRDAELEAVRTWRAPAGENHEQRASAALERALRHAPERLRIRRHTAEGHARRLLVSASFAADLLVVGTRSRAGHLGLVTHRVLHDAACPVAVVPERRR
ncbi:universal stress protein [Streptomyces acidiscabies]|uniref:universal stress protein n=1 Tax=Streptomyces acidiscabies TaxID=42234 RepID=UPI0038F5EDD3